MTSSFRKLDSEKLATAKAEFKQLEEDNIIQRSISPWSSLLHMVRNAVGNLHPCGDFRRLNLLTKPDVYPLPNMLDLLPRRPGAQFSPRLTFGRGTTRSLSTRRMFRRQPVLPPLHFEYMRMPFGLRNAGPLF
jgi:hypothetical protein